MKTKEYYLIQDPYHPYAVDIIQALAKLRPDLNPIAFYSNPRQKFFLRKQFNLKKYSSDGLEYIVKDHQMDDFIGYLKPRYSIKALIPWNELIMDNSINMIEKLNINWNDVHTLSHFRDKFKMKDHLCRTQPELICNPSRKIASIVEFQKIYPELDGNFVIKPNSGYSNQCIGFFDKDTPMASIASYFDSANGFEDFIVEARLTGTEYAVNGQTHENGDVSIYSIFEYRRAAANGRSNVYSETWNINQDHPRFSAIYDYAKKLIRATGLQRSPFHLELIDDEKFGPSLVEVGCRPGGGHMMDATNLIHNHSIDVFEVAAHYYVNTSRYANETLNWEYGSNISFLDLDGITNKEGRVYRIKGKKKVESRPEFVRWTTEPILGQKMFKTVDLETLPWAVHLFSQEGEQHLSKVACEIRESLVFNKPSNPILKFLVRLKCLVTQVYEKILWWLFNWKSKRPVEFPKNINSFVDSKNDHDEVA